MIEELIEEGQYQVALSRLTDMDDEMTRYYRLVCLNALEDYQRCMQEGAVAKMQANNTYYEVTALYLNALKELEEYDEKVIFLGDGVEVHRETIENELKNEFVFAPVHLSKQSAAAVAVLGSIYFEQGKAESADEHKPIYLRKSQAEREREERLKNQG